VSFVAAVVNSVAATLESNDIVNNNDEIITVTAQLDTGDCDCKTDEVFEVNDDAAKTGPF